MQRLTVFISSTIVYAIFIVLFWSYSIDDAFITFRFAEHLADGHGLVFNIGADPIEGYSNFLWLLILALLYGAGLPTYLCAKVLGVVGIWLAALFIYDHFRRTGPALSWLAGPLFLISPVTALWAVSGLELGLHTVLMILSILTLLKRSRWLYALLPLLVISRPEGVGAAAVMLVVGAVSEAMNKRPRWEYYLTGFVITALALGGLMMFRMSVFGYPLPNTFYAKMHHGTVKYGFLELAQMLLLFAPLTVTLFWGIVRIVRKRLTENGLAIFVTLFLFQAVVSSSVDPVMNFHFRYMLPFLPLLIMTGLTAASVLIRRPSSQWIAVILFAVSLMLPLKQVNATVGLEREIWEAQRKFIKWAEPLPQQTSISMTDMGRIPYYADKTYYDLWGLTNEDIGRDGFEPRREFARLPDYFVLVGYLRDDRIILRFGREEMIAYNRTFHSVYKFVTVCHPEGIDPGQPGYHYLIFALDPAVPLPEIRPHG